MAEDTEGFHQSILQSIFQKKYNCPSLGIIQKLCLLGQKNKGEEPFPVHAIIQGREVLACPRYQTLVNTNISCKKPLKPPKVLCLQYLKISNRYLN